MPDKIYMTSISRLLDKIYTTRERTPDKIYTARERTPDEIYTTRERTPHKSYTTRVRMPDKIYFVGTKLATQLMETVHLCHKTRQISPKKHLEFFYNEYNTQ